jgi:hypothetical protein
LATQNFLPGCNAQKSCFVLGNKPFFHWVRINLFNHFTFTMMTNKSISFSPAVITLLMFGLFLASCNQASITPESDTNLVKKPTNGTPIQEWPGNCKTQAIVRHNLCGIGLWGPYVLELADGTIIQPWSASDDIAKLKVEAGMPLVIGWAEVERDNRHDQGMRCKAMGEYEARIAKTVHVHCLTVKADSALTTKTTATVRDNICGLGVWGAFVLELKNGDVLQPWELAPSLAKTDLKVGQVISIEYVGVARDNRYDDVFTCRALGPYTDRIKGAIKISGLDILP